MYAEGNLIYFTPFYFKDGSESKPKYFLVLKVIDQNVILASLPSSVDHLPKNISSGHGCLEIPEGCINCYIFKAGKVITENNWSFPRDTFLYGQWIDEYKIDLLDDIYPIDGIDYEIVGKITNEEMLCLIKCFTNSASVKRKYKRLLLP